MLRASHQRYRAQKEDDADEWIKYSKAWNSEMNMQHLRKNFKEFRDNEK